MRKNGIRPIHPGEILREEYLVASGLSVNALAKCLKVPPSRIYAIVARRRGVSPDTALRLARFFGGDARSWLNLQIAYDLKIAVRTSAKAIAKEVPPLAQLTKSGRQR